MIAFDNPIFLYSEYCEFSKNFILALRKNPELLNQFVKISIDIDPDTKKRPAVIYEIQQHLGMPLKEVPTIIVENGEYMLSGLEAFKWLDFQMQTLERHQEELQGYNTLEMGSFSDQYSKFGSSELHDATDQTFKFINRNDDVIVTPEEDNKTVKNDDFEKKQLERESFANIPRQSSVDKKITFSKKTSESTTSKFDNASDKQKDLDLRYKQLLNDRDSVLPKPQRMESKQVDFQSGRIY